MSHTHTFTPLLLCPSIDVAELEGGESKVTTLIGAAASIDNVCRMDPLGTHGSSHWNTIAIVLLVKVNSCCTHMCTFNCLSIHEQ